MNPNTLIACIQISLLRRPLLHAETAMDCLDKTRFELNAMIQNGELAFVFDLATSQNTRKEPRIFTLCVAEMTGWKSPAGQTKNFRLSEVVSMILPQRDLRSTELKRIFA